MVVSRLKTEADFIRELFIGIGDHSPSELFIGAPNHDYPIVTAAATEGFTTCNRLYVPDVFVVEAVRPAVMEIGPARDSNGDLGPTAVRALINIVPTRAQCFLPSTYS
jgi:hypothetical protein